MLKILVVIYLLFFVFSLSAEGTCQTDDCEKIVTDTDAGMDGCPEAINVALLTDTKADAQAIDTSDDTDADGTTSN